MLRRLISLGTIASLVLSGYALAPVAAQVAQVLGIRDDPGKVLLYRLSTLDKPAYDREIAQALGKDDPELARSLADLARAQNIVIDDATLQKITAAEQFSLTRSTRQLFTGAVTGEADSPTAFAGALAADLTVVGDIRDLSQQAFAYPDQDNLTVVLAATGIILTGATAFTVGTSTAGKVGVSAIKAARKMKRLSKGLERQLVRLAETGGALSHVFGKQGYRATLQVLEVADDTADVRKLRRISDGLGTKFRGALHLKRGAKLTLRVAEIAFAFLWWISAIVGWLLWAAWVAARLSWKTGRLASRAILWMLRRRPPPLDLHFTPDRSIATPNS
jgi:hypothetical protein